MYFQTEVVVSSIVINGLFISKSKKKTKVEGYYFPIRELEGNFGKCVISAFFSQVNWILLVKEHDSSSTFLCKILLLKMRYPASIHVFQTGLPCDDSVEVTIYYRNRNCKCVFRFFLSD